MVISGESGYSFTDEEKESIKQLFLGNQRSIVTDDLIDYFSRQIDMIGYRATQKTPGCRSLLLDINKINEWDPNIISKILHNPGIIDDITKIFESMLSEQYGDGFLDLGYFHVRPILDTRPIDASEFDAIFSGKVGKLISIKTRIIRVSKKHPVPTSLMFRCPSCSYEFKREIDTIDDEYLPPPKKCPNEECPSKYGRTVSWVKVMGESKFIDGQEIRINDFQDEIYLLDDLVDSVNAGDDAILTGILTAKDVPKSNKISSPKYSIRVVSIVKIDSRPEDHFIPNNISTINRGISSVLENYRDDIREKLQHGGERSCYASLEKLLEFFFPRDLKYAIVSEASTDNDNSNPDINIYHDGTTVIKIEAKKPDIDINSLISGNINPIDEFAKLHKYMQDNTNIFIITNFLKFWVIDMQHCIVDKPIPVADTFEIMTWEDTYESIEISGNAEAEILRFIFSLVSRYIITKGGIIFENGIHHKSDLGLASYLGNRSIDMSRYRIDEIMALVDQFKDNRTGYIDFLISAIAPGIMGHDMEKLALLVSAASIDKINVLFVGDHGTGKSTLLKSMEGIRDDFYWIEKGKSITDYPNGSLLCVDDAHDIETTKQEKLAKQIASNNITAIASSIPRYGSVLSGKTIQSQIMNIRSSLFNQFDLFFLFRDIPNVERDNEVVDRMIKKKRDGNEVKIKTSLVRDLVIHSRVIALTNQIEMDDAANSEIKSIYNKARAVTVDVTSGEVRSDLPIPVNPKTLVTIMNISRAMAQLRFSPKVDVEDVEMTKMIIMESQKQIMLNEVGEVDAALGEIGKLAVNINARDSMISALYSLQQKSDSPDGVEMKDFEKKILTESKIMKEMFDMLINIFKKEGKVIQIGHFVKLTSEGIMEFTGL